MNVVLISKGNRGRCVWFDREGVGWLSLVLRGLPSEKTTCFCVVIVLSCFLLTVGADCVCVVHGCTRAHSLPPPPSHAPVSPSLHLCSLRVAASQVSSTLASSRKNPFNRFTLLGSTQFEHSSTVATVGVRVLREGGGGRERTCWRIDWIELF